MFNIIKLIRNNDLKTLGENLIHEINGISEDWSGIQNFRLHKMNRKFVKHLLSRISSYIDFLTKKEILYTTYQQPNGAPYEIEHIWANKFDEHSDEFDQNEEFQTIRNSIGALILLPKGTNQSFSSDKYEDKLEHYQKENTYAQSLHPNCYIKNPNFTNSKEIIELEFKAHLKFKRKDVEERAKLVQRICEKLWSTDFFQL
ncbi:DUF1524 domain-containing protein [Sebaldella sp. S0638]|uniref:GmrSD restriction endonuclease domain-containing protein n=1 Tax=Sebaldella sp. S0638 TaxID=2957809 RepID=UPI00209EFC4B|nr:DUF1524 domain-containing protein [Sebaldella sp. S0638]